MAELSEAAVKVRERGKVEALGAAAARGAAWMIGLTVASKVVGLLGQVVLARLLLESDFGLYALALTVPTVTGILSQAGIKQVLVQRQGRYGLWQNPGFWMSLTLGILGAVLTVIFAPLAAILFGGGSSLLVFGGGVDLLALTVGMSSAVSVAFGGGVTLVVMMGIIGLTMVASAAGTVPEARMQIDLRFRASAIMNAVSVVGAMVLSAGMAWWGWGPYSFVVPNLAGAMVRTGAMWWMTRPTIRWKMEIRRWRYLTVDTGYLLVTQLMMGVLQRADSVVLGVMYVKSVVGQYFFAYNLSLQTVQLLVVNLSGVLFAALNKLQEEPERQAAAFLRALRVLALVGVPASVAQAAVAEPGVHLLFGAKWEDAILPLMILSVGSAFGMMGGPAMSLLQAQGRFRAVMWMSGMSAVLFVGTVWGAAKWSNDATVAMHVAVAVSVYWAVSGLVWVRLAVGQRATWSAVAAVFVWPMVIGLVAGAAGWGVTRVFDGSRLGNFMACVAGVALTSGVYLVLLRVFAGAWYRELMGVVGRFMPGRVRRVLGVAS